MKKTISKIYAFILSAITINALSNVNLSGAISEIPQFFKIKSNILLIEPYDITYDINNDGTVNVFDYLRSKNELLDEKAVERPFSVTNVISVKKDGTGDFSKLKSAIESIKYSDETNKYVVKVYNGTYNLLEELGGKEYLYKITSTSSSRSGIKIPDYCDVIGVGDVTIEYLPDDSISNYYTTAYISPFEVYGNTRIENIKINAKNCRYCIHDETNNNPMYNNSVHVYKNCIFTHLGNKIGTWGSPAAIASGTSGGCSYSYTDCIFNTKSWTPWSMHNNGNQDSIAITFDGCIFNGESSEGSIRFGYYKKNTKRNRVFIKNSISTGNIIIRKEVTDVESDNVWDIYNFTDINVVVK